ncbi:MAG: phosphatase PAP2 family protein [Candidatus Theseobacter exili]|nr:phosphatase PAP2 family protein [Candidatus Theseobacter exili]
MDNLLRKTILCGIILVLVYLVFFIFFDKTIDQWVFNNYSDTWLNHLGEYISYLATGSFIKFGITCAFIVILICDSGLEKQWTRLLLYICLSVSLAIIIGEGFKYLLGRHRPVMLFDKNLYGLHFFSSNWELNSTPSGHTIRAFSLFTALSLLFQRFAFIFISIAVIIGISRVIVTAHFPSDVLFGAFIGTFTAIWTYKYYFKTQI